MCGLEGDGCVPSRGRLADRTWAGLTLAASAARAEEILAPRSRVALTTLEVADVTDPRSTGFFGWATASRPGTTLLLPATTVVEFFGFGGSSRAFFASGSSNSSSWNSFNMTIRLSTICPVAYPMFRPGPMWARPVPSRKSKRTGTFESSCMRSAQSPLSRSTSSTGTSMTSVSYVSSSKDTGWTKHVSASVCLDGESSKWVDVSCGHCSGLYVDHIMSGAS
mmetsp:Transcript_31329/g.83342  ORF Transcript_31329/g.83342 Transcript_31329/m.83342 type:complete len:222 (-) Transcript_31329:63-728(-)